MLGCISISACLNEGDSSELQKPELSSPSVDSEDPRSKRRGHRLFDHSFFPDAAIIPRAQFRRQHLGEFKYLYLALQSPFFFRLFYGTDATGLDEIVELDCDPEIFGDLLDIIYPSYKKTDCCQECTSSTKDRLNLAIKLQLNFAIKRLRKGKLASKSYEWVPISERFPDASTITVRGLAMRVSASTLSLHSPVMKKLLYPDGQLAIRANLDMDRKTFYSFVLATTGLFPPAPTCDFLDTLLHLKASYLYDFYLSEMNKKVTALSRKEAFNRAMALLRHYDKQSSQSAVLDMTVDELEKLLSKCDFLPLRVKEALMEDSEAIAQRGPITIFVKKFTGQTETIWLVRGASTTVEEAIEQMEKATGIPADQQYVSFCGKLLDRGRTLGEYGIDSESTIHQYLRLRGC